MEKNTKQGFVHSIETFATVDGPGTRCVVFLQGCSFRCLYCHNPDTWAFGAAKLISAEELVKKVLRYKSYYGKKGGITLSGGEPLMQPDFAAEIFRLCREQQINTALDTAGKTPNDKIKRVVDYSDLILLDIKHCDPKKFKQLTGSDISETLDFLDYITEQNKDFWVRQVIVPEINDTAGDIEALCRLLTGRDSLRRIELLPYHTLGVEKWHKLGLEYKLENVAPVENEKLKSLKAIISDHWLPIV